MDTVAPLAAIALGLAFVVAGASKLAVGGRWPVDAAGLGVARPVAVAVPWVELVVGATSIVRVAMPAPPIAALVLLAAFTLVIVRELRAGRHPSCACFGAWSAKPIGPLHVARNAGLAGLGVVAVWA